VLEARLRVFRDAGTAPACHDSAVCRGQGVRQWDERFPRAVGIRLRDGVVAETEETERQLREARGQSVTGLRDLIRRIAFRYAPRRRKCARLAAAFNGSMAVASPSDPSAVAAHQATAPSES
jgi:hypothetical protein